MNLKKEISAVHVMLVDLKLYLNTHPSDQEALSKYNAYVKQLSHLTDEYNQNYGMISSHSMSPYPWQWINEPWPWDYEANFRL
ncbi:spore coat protein CotJB [Anaerosacchariphilus polymeriproducens]|uniref:Spore coat protein CotJB n=2 Tax=Anaerosacchariphilus polymeriproducens TaxID=1812858 RepID=A0A371ARV0_9FIRM|nr:spore coat protein CotJB [Anaerosacchariphilus polymeriproducens]